MRAAVGERGTVDVGGVQLTGTLYTQPGLVSKLFDNELQPSIEFIQDDDEDEALE